MLGFFRISKEDTKILVLALMITLLIFSLLYYKYVYAVAVSLTVSVQSALSFSVSTDQFGNLTPGTYKFATSTLGVTTNNANGWNVTLSGDDKDVPSNNMVMDLDTDAAVNITDDSPQWIIPAAAATTTAGNASTLTAGEDVLAIRVMTASSTNGQAFISTSWWGTSDTAFAAGNLWAGIASSTNVSRIGNAGTGSYSASAHLNTVQYYLDVPASQQTGAYSGPLTYSATAN